MDLDQLESAIREAAGSQYHPRPELVCLENTHSSAGGRALPLGYLKEVRGPHSPRRQCRLVGPRAVKSNASLGCSL